MVLFRLTETREEMGRLAGRTNPRSGRGFWSVLTMLAGAAVSTTLLRFGVAVRLFFAGICVLLAPMLYSFLAVGFDPALQPVQAKGEG